VIIYIFWRRISCPPFWREVSRISQKTFIHPGHRISWSLPILNKRWNHLGLAIRKGETWGLSSNPPRASEIMLPTRFWKIIRWIGLWDYWTKPNKSILELFSSEALLQLFRSFSFIDFRIRSDSRGKQYNLSLKYAGAKRPEVKDTEADPAFNLANSTTLTKYADLRPTQVITTIG